MKRASNLRWCLAMLALGGVIWGRAAAQEAGIDDVRPEQAPEETAPAEEIAPPSEIELPTPEEVQGQRSERSNGGPSTPLRIRAPYTDVDLEPGEPGQIRVRTPWANVYVGRGGVHVNTPVGPIHIGADQLREALPPREKAQPAGPRPAMGIRLRDDGGIRISSVSEGSPAAKANLGAGDRIISVAGVRYANSNSLINGIRRLNVGEQVRVIIERDGNRYRADVKLEPYAETFADQPPAEQTAEF